MMGGLSKLKSMRIANMNILECQHSVGFLIAVLDKILEDEK